MQANASDDVDIKILISSLIECTEKKDPIEQVKEISPNNEPLQKKGWSTTSLVIFWFIVVIAAIILIKKLLKLISKRRKRVKTPFGTANYNNNDNQNTSPIELDIIQSEPLINNTQLTTNDESPEIVVENIAGIVNENDLSNNHDETNENQPSTSHFNGAQDSSVTPNVTENKTIEETRNLKIKIGGLSLNCFRNKSKINDKKKVKTRILFETGEE